MYHEIFIGASAFLLGLCAGVTIERTAMSRRKIKRPKIYKTEKMVIVTIGRESRKIPFDDIPLFIAENITELAEFFGMETPDFDVEPDKMAKEHDLKKISSFMDELRTKCFEQGILKNDGGQNEGTKN